MSLINTNPSNQSEISGKQVVTFVSGGTLAVTIVGGLTSNVFADVASSLDFDDELTSTDALATQSFGYGYDAQNDVWARNRLVSAPSGFNYALLVKPQEPPTYSLFVDGASLTSGRQFLALYNKSDSVFRIKSIRLTQTGGVAGGAVVLHVGRFNRYQPSGTRLNINSFDTRNSESGAALDAVFNATNISGDGLETFSQFYTHNANLFGDPTIHESGTSTKGIVPSLFQNTEMAPSAGLDGCQPLTLSSGYGITVGEDTDYSPRSGGAFSARMVFTIEPS